MAFVNDRWHKKVSGKKVRTKAYGTKGKRWQTCWVDSRGIQRSRCFATEAEAGDYLDEITTQRRTGTYVDPKLGRAAVGSLAAKWLEIKVNVTPKTLERYREIVTSYVEPEWRKAQVADVMPSDVQAWVASLSKRTVSRKGKARTVDGRHVVLSPASIHKIFHVFSMLMTLAVRDGRIARNPCREVELPTVVHKKRRCLTHVQVNELAKLAATPRIGTRAPDSEREASDAYRLVVLVLAYCGLRFGELAALRVSSVNPLRGRIEVEQSVTEVEGVFVWGAPKSHEKRSVPVPKFLMAELESHLTGKAPDDLLFAGVRAGGPLRNRVFRRGGFDRAAAAIGLPGLTPHELRHTAASLAVSSGANVKAVQRMLGHHSAAMTLDVYADLFDDDLDAVAVALDTARAGTLSAPATESSLNAGDLIALAQPAQASARQ
jgi:integrase